MIYEVAAVLTSLVVAVVYGRAASGKKRSIVGWALLGAIAAYAPFRLWLVVLRHLVRSGTIPSDVGGGELAFALYLVALGLPALILALVTATFVEARTLRRLPALETRNITVDVAVFAIVGCAFVAVIASAFFIGESPPPPSHDVRWDAPAHVAPAMVPIERRPAPPREPKPEPPPRLDPPSMPLHAAADRADPAAVKTLLEAGADPDAWDDRRRTPLDYARRARERGRPGAVRVIALLEHRPGLKLHVRVLAEDGEPVAGARVRLVGRRSASAVTDAEGRALLRGVGPGRCGLIACWPYGLFSLQQVEIRARSETDTELVTAEVKRMRRATGRVVDEAGAPRAGMVVHVALDVSKFLPGDGRGSASEVILTSSVTDEAGRFMNQAPSSEAFVVRARDAQGNEVKEVVPAGTDEPHVVLVLPRR